MGTKLANHVIKDKLIIGRYPLVESRHKEGLDLLRRLEAKGVTTYVCLQQEVPGQTDQWPRKGIKVRGRLCLPYRPHVQQFARGRPVNFIHEPIPDRSVSDETKQMVLNIAQRIQSGEVVYLHCMGGRGRSGCVAAAVLVSLYGMPGEEALDVVQIGYDSRHYDASPCPETQQQRDFVLKWERKLDLDEGLVMAPP